MITDFEVYYGYDIDDELPNEGALAQLLEDYEVFADCGELLYCRNFILIPDYDTDTVGVVVKPEKDKDKLKAYLEAREYFLSEAKHKVMNFYQFETEYMI